MERTETRNPLKKVVVIGFPYTNKTDTARGIDRYLAILYKIFAEHHMELKIIEDGVVKPKTFQFLNLDSLNFLLYVTFWQSLYLPDVVVY